MGPFVRYWVPVVAYVVLIFWVSSISGVKLPGAGAGLDKLAHAVEYGILCFLLVRALRESGVTSRTALAGVVSLILGLLVGLADELYQSMIPGRESDPADYTADAVGLVAAILIYAAFRRRRHRRR